VVEHLLGPLVPSPALQTQNKICLSSVEWHILPEQLLFGWFFKTFLLANDNYTGVSL
jgi:hypothetical protein